MREVSVMAHEITWTQYIGVMPVWKCERFDEYFAVYYLAQPEPRPEEVKL
jgi:hypothetical protein